VTASGFVGPVTGNITGNVTGNVTGNLTGTATTATTVDILNTNGLSNVYYPTFVENRTDGQILRGDVDLTYRTDDNILTVPNVSATTFTGALTGNVTGNINSSGVSTLTTLNGTSGLVSLGSTIRTKGFVETQTTASVASNILNLDASQGTVFTHTTSAQIGIVSFTGIRTDTAATQTFSVLVRQGASPTNTTAATGIGTVLATVRIVPGNVGYSTHIKVGAGSSIVLTGTAGALDLLTFIVSYNGAASIANTSFTVVGFAATDFRNAIV
jgi:hypothetical protein